MRKPGSFQSFDTNCDSELRVSNLAEPFISIAGAGRWYSVHGFMFTSLGIIAAVATVRQRKMKNPIRCLPIDRSSN